MVHGPKQNVLLPTTIHGKAFFQISGFPPGIKFRYSLYEISSKLKKVMSRNELPCYKGSNPSIYDCFEKHIQSDLGCILPWRITNETHKNPVCGSISALRKFKHTYAIYKSGTEEEVYNLTGCYFGCSFQVGHWHIAAW